MTDTSHAGESLEILFDAKALAPITQFMAKNDIRYYLNGISVMKHPSGGCMVVATNGHQMGVWYDKDGKCNADAVFKISPALISAAKKKSTPTRGLRGNKKISYTGGRLVLSDYNGDGSVFDEIFIQAGNPIIEGNYPKIPRVMPDLEDLQPGILCSHSSHLMSAVLKAGEMLGKNQRGYYLGVYHYTSKKRGGAVGNNGFDEQDWGIIVTRFEGCDNFVAYTMPMRVSRDKNLIPPAFEAFRMAPNEGGAA